jgi:hypothetical protein
VVISYGIRMSPSVPILARNPRFRARARAYERVLARARLRAHVGANFANFRAC